MSSGSQSTGSQSSDVASEDGITIPFALHRGSIHPVTDVGTLYLEMPLSEKSGNADQYPLIRLDIKDEDQVGCLDRMKQLQHENVLALHFFEKDVNGGVRAFVEPYTGYVSDLFTQARYFVNQDTRLVPSDKFQEIVSVSMKTLEYIIRNGQYHGNFSFHTMVYKQEPDGKQIFKLSNFENKNKTPLECKLGDCHGLAFALEKVSQRVRHYYPDFKLDTCCVVDDLARRLRAITTSESLCRMNQDNEDHPFFWDDVRKRSFCAYELPKTWHKPSFLQSFQGSPSAPPLPWNTIWKSDDYFTAMESYRVANGIKEYDFMEVKDFLRFISGLYTHQEELKKKGIQRSVDNAVLFKHPRILLDLKIATEADGMDVD